MFIFQNTYLDLYYALYFCSRIISHQWIRDKANEENLQKLIKSTGIHVINVPQKDYPLLVLDLDHTFLDFSSQMLQRAESHIVGDENTAKLK